jgi:2-methylcitrate dehydratase PrpD
MHANPVKTSHYRQEDLMTWRRENWQSESSIDRRLFLGAAGALTLAAQPALASQAEAKSQAQSVDTEKRLSDTIADFVVGFDAAALPPLAAERVRLAFIDTLAVMLAGSREDGTGIVCDMVQQEGAAAKVSVVGQSFRTSPQLAALANGVAAHIMDYDFSSLLGQPTSPIIPALLPLAESLPATPAEVTAAFTVGFEVCLKLARAAPEQTSVGGWHAVSSIGTIGAAMACARLLKVPRERIADVLGIAASLSGGLSANFGTMTKPLHAGTSARNAILSATLGGGGFTANAAALEHPVSGYFRAFDRGMKVSFEPIAELGRSYDILERGFKPKRYPCGGLGHTAIDATLELRSEIKAADVAAIKVSITKFAASRIGSAYPTSIESAKFSMPYVAAYTALYGAPMLKAFTEAAIDDESVKALAGKVSVAIDPEFADLLEESPSRVTVVLADGRTVERTRYYASGTPQAPFTQDQVEEKFFSCAERAVDKASATKIFAFLNRIEQENSFGELWELVKRA